MKTFPTLYKKTSTGAIQEWHIEALIKGDDPNVAIIEKTFGQLGGKKQVAHDFITKGKNIGRANETTAYEQAVSEAQSQWEKKKKAKNYVESVEDAEAGIVDALVLGGADVMLAHSYSKQGHKITYPCYVQPKLDGHRCVAVIEDGVCTLWSRTRKQIFGVPHIVAELEEAFEDYNVILDGELYNHDYKDRFEELTSFIRQEVPKPGHEVVQYWVYDRISPEFFYARIEKNEDDLWPSDILDKLSPSIVCVETEECEDEVELLSWFYTFLRRGFEGAMARNHSSLYVGKRSYDLQKIKEFDDAEFLIVDVESGRGKMADKGVFVCETAAGERFKAKMMGSLDDLVDLVNNPQDYIGKYVTVKFQGLTNKNGVPRFPVAVRMREDL